MNETVTINDMTFNARRVFLADADLVKLYGEAVYINPLAAVNFVFRQDCVLVNIERWDAFVEMASGVGIDVCTMELVDEAD